MPRLVETTIPCCVCGWYGASRWRTAGDHLLGGPREFRAVQCVRCRTVRLDPRPSPEEMSLHYTATTYARTEEEDQSELTERLNAYTQRLVTRILEQLERFEQSHSSVPKNVLDVGCGDGRFLAQMCEEGWETAGLETDSVATRMAQERNPQATITETSLDKANLPQGAYGLVTLHHVLEHVPHPRETLEQAYNLLAPGGMLFLALPNIASIEAKVFRSTWCPLDLPRHFWGFQPHSLTRLVEEVGFHQSQIAHFPLSSTPQSLRYAARALSGKSPSGNTTQATPFNLLKPLNERGGLRTKSFRTLLSVSEELGHYFPGEVMELVAFK